MVGENSNVHLYIRPAVLMNRIDLRQKLLAAREDVLEAVCRIIDERGDDKSKWPLLGIGKIDPTGHLGNKIGKIDNILEML